MEFHGDGLYGPSAAPYRLLFKVKVSVTSYLSMRNRVLYEITKMVRLMVANDIFYEAEKIRKP